MKRRSFLKVSLLSGAGVASLGRTEVGRGAAPAGLTHAASAEGPEAKPPFTVGPFRKIYEPGPPWPVPKGATVPAPEHWHVNDHCFMRGPDGTWHMFGIVAANPGFPAPLNALGHATAKELLQPRWVAAAPPFERDDEEVLWAPHVISHQGVYHMFYCSGSPSSREHPQPRSPQQWTISLRTSKDLWQWSPRIELAMGNPRTGFAPFRDGFQARDPMVLWDPDAQAWAMYYTATERPTGGNHIVACRTSTDLRHWSERRVAYRDAHLGTDFGPTESPFVVRRGNDDFLFIGPRPYSRPFPNRHNWEHPGYVGTDVFRSRRRGQWSDADHVGHIRAHALEVVQDEKGQWYVSSAGIGQGGLYLAELHWVGP